MAISFKQNAEILPGNEFAVIFLLYYAQQTSDGLKMIRVFFGLNLQNEQLGNFGQF